MDFFKRYEEMGEVFDPLQVAHKSALRINTLKISEAQLVKRLKKRGVSLEKISFLKNGYFFEADFSLASTQEYLQGYFYIQDASSQACVEVLDPKPGELVLDMAASPGGKCSHISQLMNNEGVVFALEENKSRIWALLNNLERLCANNVLVFKKDARFAHDFNLLFDKVLLDAPCGGNFCVEENYFKVRSQRDLDSRARLQKELLRSAYLSLKKGGVLVYSTCSLEPEENEFVLNWLLSEFGDLSVIDTNLKIGSSGVVNFNGLEFNSQLKKGRRFWPHKTGTDGFFIARLKKWD